MEDFLQKPQVEDAPVSKSEKPWAKQIEYRSGKTPEGFAVAALPENVKAGFTYYDKDQKASFQVTGFTASIIAILSGVSGTVPNGQRYDNYWSSLVADTRTQKLSVFLGSGDNRVTIASGIYNDFKATLPDGVNYMKFAVVYIHETKECALMELTASFENSIKEAIAAETGQNPARINVFNLFELSSKFWAVRFSGSFTKRNRDGVAWAGKGDMFFYPELKAGVVMAEKFPVLTDISGQVDAYIEAGQKYFATSQSNQPRESFRPTQSQLDQADAMGFVNPATAPRALSTAPTYGGNPFPTEAPPVMEGEEIDLPF